MKALLLEIHSTFLLSLRLFRRTIGAKYRKSFLGYFWMIAPAVLISGGVSLASKSGIINPGQTDLPYPVFVFLGVLVWQVFTDALEVGHKSFEGARTYITRVYFPREAIVLAQFYESVVTTIVRLILVVVLVSFIHPISFSSLSIICTCFVSSLLLGLGAGVLIMPFTILFEDLQNSIKLFFTYGMFLTTAMYQPQGHGIVSTLVYSNPLSILMNVSRQAAAGVSIVQSSGLLIVFSISIFVTITGFVLLRLAAPIVIERMLTGGR